MYFPQLTFPRYFAATIVLMVHFANIDELMVMPIVGNIVRNGNTLISYFFVMTGFVLVISMKRNGQFPAIISPKLILLHRIIRLYPLHWVALALTLLLGLLEGVLHPATRVLSPIEPGTLVAHVLLLHAWYPVKSFAVNFNYVSWFLCVEMLLALLAPWLYRWLFRLSTGALIRTTSLLWLGSLLLHQAGIRLGMPVDWGYIWPPCHIPEFMLGMVGGFLVCRHLPTLRQWARQLHGLAHLCTALMIGLMGVGVTWLHQSSLVFAPCYLAMILSITVSDNWLTRLCCTKPFMYLGKISYGVYIFQFPVAILILRCLHPWVGWPYRYSALLFVMSLTGVAALAYEWVEKPSIAYARSWLTRRMVQPEPEPSHEGSVVAPVVT